jgi:hypothetical protein
LTSLLAASIVLALILALVVFYRAHRRTRVRQVEWWVAFANQHRLAIHNPGEPHDLEVEGRYRGVQLKAFMAGGHISTGLELYTHAVAKLPGGSPPGLLITTHSLLARLSREKRAPKVELEDPDLAGVVDVFGVDGDKTWEMMADPTLRGLLLEATKRADYVRVDARTVTLEAKGVLDQKLPGFADLACRIAAAVSEAHERPWVQFAQKNGLLLRGAGTPSPQRVLRGHMKGQRVSIEMGTLPGNAEVTFTTIKVGLGVRLPAGFRLAPPSQPAPRGAFKVGVRSLDSAMQVQGTNRDAVVALLTQPALRDHLIAFYEVCPFTIIERNAVTAGGPGLLTGDMGAQVSAVMDLAVAFRKAWAQVQRAQGRDGDSGGGKRRAARG